MKSLYFLMLLVLPFFSVKSKSFFLEENKFISYGKLPTWKGIATDWDSNPKVYIYNRKIFKGHADFISKGLGKKITFNEFKYFSKSSKHRKYLPFYIYDLRKLSIVYNKKKYNFALRLQDYNYEDDPQKLTEEIIKLCFLLYGESQKVFPIRPLIVLNKNKNSSLNLFTLGKPLEEKKYSYIPLHELLEISGSKKLEVLNSGIAVGLLKYITNEKDLEKVTPEDIIILNFLPDRLPPVAGIITTEPQTPLSHINLLAKNRGTFNMYILDLDILPGLKELIGENVYIDDKDEEVSVHKVSEEFVKNYRLKNPIPKVKIPKIRSEFLKIIPLIPKYQKFLSARYIGAKASNYYKILQLIPEYVKSPAFALGFKPYFEVLRQGANDKIQELLKNKSNYTPKQKKEKLKEIRETILSSKVPDITLQSFQGMIQIYFPDTRIRLRSSTNCEDLLGFNGAGLYVSKGFQTSGSLEELSDKLLQVYASFWNEFAFEEREYFGISHEETGMAVLIHSAFVKEVANGVALTIPEKSGEINFLINTQADEISVTNPTSGIISESFYISPDSLIPSKINTYSNIRNIFLNNEEYRELLTDLTRSLLKIHKAFIKPQPNLELGVDIEFKIMQEIDGPKLYIKQARILKY